jgi:hypothetical protein
MLLTTQGCSSGGNNGDGGLPDGSNGGDGDGYTVQCSQEDVYCIVIEAGAQACGVFQDNREWSVELSNLARVHFKQGETLLPEDLTDMEADPVEMIYLGSGLTEIRRSPLSSYTEEKQ